MMEQKINIAELLKDCPTGMELGCTMYEDVYFDYVDELNNIHCYIQQEFNKTSVIFNQDGTPTSHTKSKCVIFPKGKTTWKGFQRPYEDGDIVATKFKVGDIIQDITGICKVKITEVNVEDKCYLYKSLNINGIGCITFNRQDDWELVPNKFDVINFEPFMKVLVRSDNSSVWECDFFSSYNPNCSNKFHCIGAWYNICIPYIGNEHLRGTTDDCDDYYKL